MAKPLFRQEAIDAQRDRFLGELTAARPLSLWAFTAAAVFIAAAVIAVAVWGQYTRRERVPGFLASAAGAVPLLISEPGQVTTIDVVEGQVVALGQPIAHVTIDRTLSSAASSSTAVMHELEQRQTLLAEEVKQTRLAVEQHAQQVEAIKLQVTSLGWWVKAGVSLLVVLAAVAIVLLIQLMHAR